ncbi:hypothetical protein RUM43_003823 [Polyplax serrata]|uniref:Uncharacterized protein n=1 Tax=Polyplax serrata TaxID=468196 RepID=A0AAN8PG57_POLSC
MVSEKAIKLSILNRNPVFLNKCLGRRHEMFFAFQERLIQLTGRGRGLPEEAEGASPSVGPVHLWADMSPLHSREGIRARDSGPPAPTHGPDGSSVESVPVRIPERTFYFGCSDPKRRADHDEFGRGRGGGRGRRKERVQLPTPRGHSSRHDQVRIPICDLDPVGLSLGDEAHHSRLRKHTPGVLRHFPGRSAGPSPVEHWV